MGINHQGSIVTDGLVLCLDAANPKSYSGTGNTWFDLSGNSNHGTLTNSPTYNSENKGSLVFDGINDYGQIANSSSTNSFINQISVEITFKYLTTAGGGNYPSLLMKSTTNSWNDGFGFYWYNGNFAFYINAWNTYKAEFVISGSIPLATYCGVYNGSNVLLYKNGSLLVTGSALSANIINSSSRLFLGCGTGAGTNLPGYYSNSVIYNTKIYNRALSESEIKQNFNATRGRYGI